MNFVLSPSLLSCDFNNVVKDFKRLKDNNIKYLHLDVMDGVFVPNISFGIPVIKCMSKIKENFIFDTHLMIIEPKKYIKDFVEAGSDIITFHLEATNNIEETISEIRKYNIKVGLSINPDSDEELLYPYLNKIDMVLVMSVFPGFGGQKFIEKSLSKIKKIKEYIDDNKINVDIEVDGGINDTNIKDVVESGANIVVSGSYIFNGDMKNNIEIMCRRCE